MPDVSDDLLSVDQARSMIVDAAPTLAPIDLPLAEAQGCVLASQVVTEYDIPPFSSAAADGVAARAADIAGAAPGQQVSLRLVGWALSGRPPEVTVGWGEGVRIARGAPIPAGADCVVPAGRFDLEGDGVRVSGAVEPGANIDPAGQDLRAGSVLVPAGRRLSAAELGALATAGYGSVPAYPRMRVAVVTIGAGLAEPGRAAAFGQARDANSFALIGGLREAGASPYRLPLVRDAELELRELLLSNLSRADALVVSGGGSEDDPTDLALVLAGLGDVRTHRVAMYPGGAVGFGLIDGEPLFSLPGDPGSALVAFEAFVRPAVLKMMGRRDLDRPEVTAVLDEPVGGPAGVSLFVPARVGRREGRWHCVPTGPADPRRVGSVVQANGFIVVPPGDRGLAAGDEVRVQIFRALDR